VTRARRAVLAIALTGAVAGCASRAVRARTTETERLIAVARGNGARRCAPVELAIAESHNDFAQHALDEGDDQDARREADRARAAAQVAITRSPRLRCADRVASLPGPGDLDGDGVLDSVDRCPRVAEDRDGFQDDDGCPDDDDDGDGIPDARDRCPRVAEDRDGFQDDDGCPDEDDDGDGIPDARDRCPSDAEDRDGFQDDDGCPDPDNDGDGILDPLDRCPDEPGAPPDGCPRAYRWITVLPARIGERIELKRTVMFDAGRATLQRGSLDLLDEVGQALRDSPAIAVEIQGHTDNRGGRLANLRLSQKRAESVRGYLIQRGIAAGRMVPRGYGESAPIASNRTASGRTKNRRIEFLITAR